MKTKFLVTVLLLSSSISYSQLDINRLLAAGAEDTQLFAENYFGPGLDAIAYSMTNGWFTSAKSKKLGQFEFSFVGNASFVSSSQKSFELNTADYNLFQFENGASIQNVANVLGENNPDITGLVVYENENGNQEQVSFTLPQGIGDAGIDFVPTAYPQLSIGFLGGLEFKFRYFPEVENDEGSSVQFYGVGVQNELTSVIPGLKLLPIHIGIAANYTNFRSDIQLGETPIVDTSNGFLESEFSAWSFSGIVSTKLKIINFYGGLSYVTASSDFGLRGDFVINEGSNAGEIITDPFVTSSTIDGFRGTVGAKLTLAFFRLNVDYNVQEFNTISAGISFGI